MLTSFALANAIVVVPEEIAAIEAGEECEAMLIGRVPDAAP